MGHMEGAYHTTFRFKLASVSRPHYSARPMCFGSGGLTFYEVH